MRRDRAKSKDTGELIIKYMLSFYFKLCNLEIGYCAKCLVFSEPVTYCEMNLVYFLSFCLSVELFLVWQRN